MKNFLRYWWRVLCGSFISAAERIGWHHWRRLILPAAIWIITFAALRAIRPDDAEAKMIDASIALGATVALFAVFMLVGLLEIPPKLAEAAKTARAQAENELLARIAATQAAGETIERELRSRISALESELAGKIDTAKAIALKANNLIGSGNEILRKINHQITTWVPHNKNPPPDPKRETGEWYDAVTAFLSQYFPERVSWFQSDIGAYEGLDTTPVHMRGPPTKLYRRKALMEHRIKRLQQIAMPELRSS